MDFATLRKQFENASTEEKIIIYKNAEGLSVDEYKILLKSFPYNELNKLEKALNE